MKKEQANIRSYLYEQTNQKARDIQNSLQQIKNTLAKPSHTLATFVEYVNSLKMCKNQKDNLIEDKKKLEEMSVTLRKFRSKEDQAFSNQLSVMQTRIEEIQGAISEIESLLTNSEGLVTDGKDNYVSEVEARIEEEKKKIVGIIAKCSEEQLMSSETDPTDAIKALNRIKKEFDDTLKKITQYRQYQETLDLPPVEIKEIAEFQKKYDVRFKLWNNLKTFREKSGMWLTKPFRDLDAQEIVGQVKEFDRDNLMLRQQLPRDNPDQILEALKAEVKEFGHHNNLVLALGNKALEQKHWDKIFGLIGQPTPALNAFNLKTLLDFKIDLEFEKVDEISAFASGEATINGQLKEISGFWETQALFTVLPYRDSKDRFIIGDIEDTIAQLEDNQMSIQTMMGSKYVAEIRGAVELWEKHLGYISDVIDEWLTFQRQWMYLENIFNAEDIQKQLPQEAKLF